MIYIIIMLFVEYLWIIDHFNFRAHHDRIGAFLLILCKKKSKNKFYKWNYYAVLLIWSDQLEIYKETIILYFFKAIKYESIILYMLIFILNMHIPVYLLIYLYK